MNTELPHAGPHLPRVYLDKAEAARTLGFSEPHLYSLERSGGWIEPDIVIGMGLAPKGRTFPGYTRERVLEFGQATRYLDADNRPIALGSGLVPRPVPATATGLMPPWFYAETRHYLSKSDLAVAWGIQARSVSMRAQRGRLPDADVAVNVSMNRGATLGYDPDRIIKASAQFGLPLQVDLSRYRQVLEEAA